MVIIYVFLKSTLLFSACSSVQQLPSGEKVECCSYEHPRSPSNDATLAFSGMVVVT